MLGPFENAHVGSDTVRHVATRGVTIWGDGDLADALRAADMHSDCATTVVVPTIASAAKAFIDLTDADFDAAWEQPMRETILAFQQAHRAGHTRLLAVVPTIGMRGGDFTGRRVINDPSTGLPFAGNVIPASRVNATSKAIQDQFVPQPNFSSGANNFFADVDSAGIVVTPGVEPFGPFRPATRTSVVGRIHVVRAERDSMVLVTTEAFHWAAQAFRRDSSHASGPARMAAPIP